MSLWEGASKLSSIGLGKVIEMILRTVTYFIDQVVYEFIIKLYNLFRLLCEARISDSKIMGELITRIGLILGLIMFFYVTFDFVQILIDPDKLQDKEKGPMNIVKKFLIVIVLFGTSKFMFDSFHKFQSIVLSPGEDGSSVIENLLLPYQFEARSFGNEISANFMQNFYKITTDEIAKTGEALESNADLNYERCEMAAAALTDDIAVYGSLSVGYYCLNAMYKSNDNNYNFYIDYNPLSCLVGIFVAWMLLMYCISVGIRAIQLGFLEIISPVAFVAYLSPKKDSMFSKFWKVYFATYIDVFIRIAIINFVVLLSYLILNLNDYGFWSSVGNPEDGATRFWLSLFMILALLSFAKKAPELIKQFLPENISKISFGLGTKDRAGLGMIGGTLAGAATGLVGGFAGGFVGSNSKIKGMIHGIGGAVGGVTGGTVRGGAAGLKGKNLREAIANANKNQAAANLKKAQLRADGVTFGEQFNDSLRGHLGLMSGYQTEDKALSMSSNVKALLEDNDVIKHLREAREAYKASGGTEAEVYSKFDAEEKRILGELYSLSYSHNKGDFSVRINDIQDSNHNVIFSSFPDTYSSNQGIYNAIHDNEKRAGKKLDSWAKYKDDNNALKTAKANRRNKGK